MFINNRLTVNNLINVRTVDSLYKFTFQILTFSFNICYSVK